MRKKRILWVNEASWKNTGYSVYANEVLSRLSQIDEFELAELACYVEHNDPESKKLPWKVYGNRPPQGSEALKLYHGNPSRVFGEQSFNEVLLDFMPDIVMDIRDWWMFEYQQRSPFRDFFHWSLMPTVDAMPQNPQWVNTFASADSVMAYSEFGRDTMLSQCKDINFIDVASPAASENFMPAIDKRVHKEMMGLDPDSVIVGTVMRNQRRKLYPDLFEAFRGFLDHTKRNNVFLYCHKYYPDIGWETPALLDQFKLNNRVLFGYRCKSCGDISIGFFQDVANYCHKCHQMKRQLIGIENAIDNVQLNNIYNMFDIYVQYANSEGFGMPQLEAAYAGVPVMTMNYSAMESVIKNIGAIPLNPIKLAMEMETGCYRAIPDNEELIDRLSYYTRDNVDLRSIGMEMRDRARAYYSWDKTADIWANHFKSIELKDVSKTWLSPSRARQPAEDMPSNLLHMTDKVNYLFTHVLHKPEWIGSHMWSKVLKDCTFGYRIYNAEDDYYFNENHLPKNDKHQPFNFFMAAEELGKLRKMWNEWEDLRMQVIMSRDLK